MAVNRDHVFDQMRDALEKIGGFAAICSENNWRDCRLLIQRQVEAALRAAEAATPIERGDFVVADPNKAT